MVVNEKAANGFARVVGCHHIPFLQVPFVDRPPTPTGMPGTVSSMNFIEISAITKRRRLVGINLHQKMMRRPQASEGCNRFVYILLRRCMFVKNKVLHYKASTEM